MSFWKLEYKRVFTWKLIGIILVCMVAVNYFQIRKVKKEYRSQFVSVNYLKMAEQNIRLADGVRELKKIFAEIEDYEEVDIKKIPPLYRQTFFYLKDTITEEEYSRGNDLKEMISLTNGKESLENLVIGYAEGWKNTWKDYKNYLVVILCLIAFMLNLTDTAEEGKNPSEVLGVTVKGISYLNENRFYFGEIAAVVIYGLSMILFYAMRIGYFGAEGYSLKIQSDSSQMESFFRITFLQENLLNFILGLMITLYWAVIILTISKVGKTFMRGLAFVLGVIGVNFLGASFFSEVSLFRFLPFQLLEHQKYYKTGEEIFGKNIPGIWSVFMISILGFLVIHYGFLKFISKER